MSDFRNGQEAYRSIPYVAGEDSSWFIGPSTVTFKEAMPPSKFRGCTTDAAREPAAHVVAYQAVAAGAGWMVGVRGMDF